jgi:hypothetical protein
MNHQILVLVLSLLVGVCAPFVTATAQELEATVRVDMQPLTLDQRQDVMLMAETVRNYLNSNRYTGQDWDGPRIPVDITIYLNGRNGNMYSARISIVTKRLVNNTPETGGGFLRVFDQDWTFEWSNSPTLVYQPLRYDQFTSVLDFYMMLAIGLDMDTYDDLGGSDMYKAALSIAQTGNAQGVSQFSTVYQPGQFTRMALVTELNDMRYQGLRRLFFDYHEAVDVYAENKDEGRTALAQVINDMAAFKRTKISNRSVVLQAYFDAKSGEIADIFKGVANPQLWADLRFLDPGKTQQYEEARQGK